MLNDWDKFVLRFAADNFQELMIKKISKMYLIMVTIIAAAAIVSARIALNVVFGYYKPSGAYGTHKCVFCTSTQLSKFNIFCI